MVLAWLDTNNSLGGRRDVQPVALVMLQGDQLHQELGARRQLGPREVLDLYSQSLLPFQSQRPQAIKLRQEVLPPH